MTKRVTKTAKRKSKRPLELTISPSWLRKSCKNWKYSTKLVSAVPTARRNMAMPINLCHGKREALLDISAPGKK